MKIKLFFKRIKNKCLLSFSLKCDVFKLILSKTFYLNHSNLKIKIVRLYIDHCLVMCVVRNIKVIINHCVQRRILIGFLYIFLLLDSLNKTCTTK